MTEQLSLAAEHAPSGPEKYTLHQHMRTKRYFAVAWHAGDPSGLAGPYPEPLAQADLPGQPYSRHPQVVRSLRQDIARRDTYSHYEYDPTEELAS